VDGEPVMLGAAAVLDRPVVDVLAGVVADRPRNGGLLTDAQVTLVGTEYHAVEVVDSDPVQAAGLNDALHRGDQVGQTVVADMTQRDKGLDGFQLDPQPHRVPERSVGVGKDAIQVAMVLGCSSEHFAGPNQDVHLQHRLVGQSVAEGGGLDTETGDGSAEGDCLQLRNHQRR
jgi:hypothetical protein